MFNVGDRVMTHLDCDALKAIGVYEPVQYEFGHVTEIYVQKDQYFIVSFDKYKGKIKGAFEANEIWLV